MYRRFTILVMTGNRVNQELDVEMKQTATNQSVIPAIQ
jgi:hypothetical protein